MNWDLIDTIDSDPRQMTMIWIQLMLFVCYLVPGDKTATLKKLLLFLNSSNLFSFFVFCHKHCWTRDWKSNFDRPTMCFCQKRLRQKLDTANWGRLRYVLDMPLLDISWSWFNWSPFRQRYSDVDLANDWFGNPKPWSRLDKCCHTVCVTQTGT